MWLHGKNEVARAHLGNRMLSMYHGPLLSCRRLVSSKRPITSCRISCLQGTPNSTRHSCLRFSPLPLLDVQDTWCSTSRNCTRQFHNHTIPNTIQIGDEQGIRTQTWYQKLRNFSSGVSIQPLYVVGLVCGSTGTIGIICCSSGPLCSNFSPACFEDSVRGSR